MPYYVYALIAACLFALLIHLQRIFVRGSDGLKGAFVSVLSSALFFWALSPLTIEIVWWSSDAVWIFALCGLVFPAFGQLMQLLSIQKVGPNVTASLGAFMPVFATLPALMFLGETMGRQGVAGMGLLITGLLLASLPGRGGKAGPADWPLVFLLFPLGAAVARGITQPLAKFGYETLAQPVFATMIMATVSTGVLGIIMLLRRRPRHFDVGWNRSHSLFFVANGILNGLAILALQQALRLGEVSRTAPLIATVPLIAWLMSALVFRSQNAGWRHLGMAGLVVAGSILVTTRPV